MERVLGEGEGPVRHALGSNHRHVTKQAHQFIFGAQLSEADIRLYTTIIRFDVGYHTLFRCNLKMIRHDYPNLHKWLLNLYWDGVPEESRGAFRSTTHFRDVSVRSRDCFGAVKS